MNRDFWIRWLSVAAALTVAVGLMSGLAARPETEAPWRLLMQLLDPLGRKDPISLSPEARITSAVLGGVMVSWGILLLMLARGPIARGDREAVSIAMTALLSWFVIDSAGSLAAGWPANVLLNLSFLAMLGTPLWALGRTHRVKSVVPVE